MTERALEESGAGIADKRILYRRRIATSTLRAQPHINAGDVSICR